MVAARGGLAIIVHPGIFRFHPLISSRDAAPLSILDMPPCIIQSVLSSLLAYELVRFGATCKEARELSNDEALWRGLCMSQFSVNPFVVMRHTFKELYRFNLECLAHVLNYRPNESGIPAFQMPTHLHALAIGAQN